MISVMGAVLVVNGLVTMWISFADQKSKLSEQQKLEAQLAATKISQFVREIEAQLQWMLMAPWGSTSLEERRIDGLRILRNTPAISEIVLVGADGREELKLSRLATDQIGSGADWSREPAVANVTPDRPYHGPVYYQRNSEPYMRIAMAGARRSAGIVVADVNLKLIWDVVAEIRFGKRGMAYVVDPTGRLIAHPDISLVLRNTDATKLDQVRLALESRADETWGLSQPVHDLGGHRVMAASTHIPGLDWFVFVELPLQEALAPARDFLNSTLIALIAGLGGALIAGLLLARKLTDPIRELQTGAALIGSGALDHRLAIRSSDELGALGAAFNDMAEQLQASYASLEGKVQERTAELHEANKAKGRFLAVASHDLRQPLHALSLFVSQLQSEADPRRKELLVERVAAAGASMNRLFDNLLDVSQLETATEAPALSPVELQPLLARIERTFGPAAADKRLTLDVGACAAWVTSNDVLLERVLQNLVSNAIRYTETGSVMVTCHDHGGQVRIDVADTGVGIDASQIPLIFGEFYRVPEAKHGQHGGLGLGLYIVDRLAKSLGHTLEVASRPGAGSTFTLRMAACEAPVRSRDSAEFQHVEAFGAGKTVLVIEDDPLALEALAGRLGAWGFDVLQADTPMVAAAVVANATRIDLVLTDYHLPLAENGIEAVRVLQRTSSQLAVAKVIVMSADTSGGAAAAAARENLPFLRKPILPMTLRTVVARTLRQAASAPVAIS